MSEVPDIVDNTADHRFEISLAGETAFAEYQLVEGAIILPHTVVPAAFEGKGVGSRLARYAIDYARHRGLKIIPLCPFMAGYIQRHAEAHDLVHPTYRERLGLPAG